MQGYIHRIACVHARKRGRKDQDEGASKAGKKNVFRTQSLQTISTVSIVYTGFHDIDIRHISHVDNVDVVWCVVVWCVCVYVCVCAQRP
jgi:hypothetical protein